jgi:Outer membrane protein beta-barrel domain
VPEGRDLQADMISRRIHRARNCVEFSPFALLFIAFLLAVNSEATAQEAVGSEEAGVSWFPAVPLRITAGVNIGYDDHVTGSSTTSSSGQSSSFARENVILTYDRGRERTQLHLIGVGRFAQFFDAGTDDKDGNVTLSLTHSYSTRLSFYSSIYAAYQTEPDFGSDVGPENVRSDFFYTKDIFSVSYHWLPRFATVTSYTFRAVKYAESSIGSFQDRAEHTIGEQLQFSLTRRTNLIGNYRFQIVDYDSAPRDSVTHFALAGVDHHLTEHITLHALGGESFRNPQNGASSMNPYVEASLGYVRSNHSLTWTTSYGFEESNLQNATSRTTIRTGLTLQYDLTSRIGATARVFYHHDENEGGSTGTTSVGSQDSFDISLGLRYTINKHFAMHVDYHHTTQGSRGAAQGYSRNRYSAGLTYTY